MRRRRLFISLCSERELRTLFHLSNGSAAEICYDFVDEFAAVASPVGGAAGFPSASPARTPLAASPTEADFAAAALAAASAAAFFFASAAAAAAAKFLSTAAASAGWILW